MPGTSALLALALADEPPHAPIPELVAAVEPELILLLGDLEGGNEWTEEEAEALLSRLPAGVNDEPDDHVHRGSAALRAWVERFEPAWLLHGHTLPDPARAVTQVGPTHVVHVRGALPLELS